MTFFTNSVRTKTQDASLRPLVHRQRAGQPRLRRTTRQGPPVVGGDDRSDRGSLTRGPAAPRYCAASAVRLTRPGRRKPTRLPPNAAVHVLRRGFVARLVLATARARLVVALRSFDLRIVSGFPAMPADQATNVTHGAPPSATHDAMIHPLRRSRYGPWELGRLRPWVPSLARPWSW